MADVSRFRETEQKAQSSEQNYQKMKRAYTNLRQEHIEVSRNQLVIVCNLCAAGELKIIV